MCIHKKETLEVFFTLLIYNKKTFKRVNIVWIKFFLNKIECPKTPLENDLLFIFKLILF